MYLWLFFHFMFEPAWHCLYYKDKTRASKSSLAIFSFATNSWAPRSFSCREHPAQIRLTAPGSVLDKILSQGPTSDIFCGWMGFCTHCPYETTEGQTRGRGAAIQDQHQRISTSCKCATAIQSWPTREVKLFLWFLGTRIISPPWPASVRGLHFGNPCNCPADNSVELHYGGATVDLKLPRTPLPPPRWPPQVLGPAPGPPLL